MNDIFKPRSGRKPAYLHKNTGNKHAKKKHPKDCTIPAMRCHKHQRDLIDLKARKAKMSRQEYMIRCSIEHELVTES